MGGCEIHPPINFNESTQFFTRLNLERVAHASHFPRLVDFCQMGEKIGFYGKFSAARTNAYKAVPQ